MSEWETQTESAAWDTSATAATGNNLFGTDNNVSKHANAGSDADEGYGRGFGGGADMTCRNCSAEGHFSKDCPEPKQMTGECFNCGQVGHNKSDCTNPKVERAFTGTCNICSEEGHRASQCPQKPAEPCNNCGELGHKVADCDAARNIGLSAVEEKSVDEAMALLKKASDEREIDDFKAAVRIYAKAKPSTTYQDLEKLFRQQAFAVYLIAMEKEMPLSLTNVDLGGKQGCKYQVGYQYSPKPRRKNFAEGWPASAEENLERLQDAGETMDNLKPVCRNCEQLGHMMKDCPEDKVEKVEAVITCANCSEEGHRMRECKAPIVDRNACRNCGGSGHRATDCPEPRSAANVECRKCNEIGHFSRDCPTGGDGGSMACHNCGQEGHRKSDCTEPANPDLMVCRNCDEKGHMSRECPKPRDYSRITCSNCQEKGHGRARCPAPVAEEASNDAPPANDFAAAPSTFDAGPAVEVAGNWATPEVTRSGW